MTDIERTEVGYDAYGIVEGEPLVKLQPHGRARRAHGRLRGRSERAREAVAGSSKISPAAGRYRRRQFGCSSTVPGRFGCSARPRASSSGNSTSGDGVAAMKFTAASTAGPGS